MRFTPVLPLYFCHRNGERQRTGGLKRNEEWKASQTGDCVLGWVRDRGRAVVLPRLVVPIRLAGTQDAVFDGVADDVGSAFQTELLGNARPISLDGLD